MGEQFLTAHQHMLGYSVPENDVEDVIKDEDIIKAILCTIKYEKQVTRAKFVYEGHRVTVKVTKVKRSKIPRLRSAITPVL